MRRTAWILAAVGMAGTAIRGIAQDTPRAAVPVRRTPSAFAPATATPVADPTKNNYSELFAQADADEPETRPAPRKLTDSMKSTKSAQELLSKDTSGPGPIATGDAYPSNKYTRGKVSAAALFETSDSGTVKRSPDKASILKADAPLSEADAGDVEQVAGTGRAVSTTLSNRNQRVPPSKSSAAPTDVDSQQLLMIDELPVDPKAPARPPKSNSTSVTKTAQSDLPELDFSNAAEEVAAEQAPPPKAKAAPLSKRPIIQREADPVEEPQADESESFDNPFAKFGRTPQSEPSDDESFAKQPATPPAAKKTIVAPPVRPRPPVLPEPEEVEEPVAPPVAKAPVARTPAAAPNGAKRSLTIPSTRQPAAEVFRTPTVDEPAEEIAAAPEVEGPVKPPIKRAPVKTARTPESSSSLSDILSLPSMMNPAPAAQPPRGVARETYGASKSDKSTGAGVTAEWVKKSEISIGQECLCELVVKNHTDSPVREVEVEAFFPANVQLVGTVPAPVRSQSSMIWKFDTLESGESKAIAIRMVPRERGNIATQAYVRFANAASGSFNVAEPMLSVELAGPNEVMIGETASHVVTIRNPGTGTASNVKVEARIPNGLEHSRGSKLMLELGSLNPGESRPVRLALAAVGGGRQVIEVKAHADGDIVQAAASEVMVIAPKLKADIQGPGLRYLGRQAVYTLTVTNDGSANTENVRVMHKIPEGFEYISSDKGATFSASNRMLNWFVGTMSRSEAAQCHVTLKATSVGPATHFIRATSEHGVIADAQVTTQIEGTAALVVEITDLDDPVEVGVETGYEIRVKNSGSAPAERVALTCELPAGARFVSASSAVSHAARGQMVEFRPVGRIAPGETVKYQVVVRGEAAGNLRFRTHLTSDSITDPLTSEELTKFYGE